MADCICMCHCFILCHGHQASMPFKMIMYTDEFFYMIAGLGGQPLSSFSNSGCLISGLQTVLFQVRCYRRQGSAASHQICPAGIAGIWRLPPYSYSHSDGHPAFHLSESLAGTGISDQQHLHWNLYDSQVLTPPQQDNSSLQVAGIR